MSELSEGEPRGTPPRRVHVLVVDDESFFRVVLERLLSEGGHRVTTAGDGESALRRALCAPPDVIVSDVSMPGMDGWTLIRRLRAEPALSLIPVIFLTALDAPRDRLQGFRLGADDYLPKGLGFEELELRIFTALDRVSRITRQLLLDRPGEPTPGATLSGRLDEIGLPALLSVFDIEQKSGVVTLTCEGRELAILLRAGHVVAARDVELAEADDRSVVFDALHWTKGRFAFRPGAVTASDAIGLPTTLLLLEAARLEDEAARSEAEAARSEAAATRAELAGSRAR